MPTVKADEISGPLPKKYRPIVDPMHPWQMFDPQTVIRYNAPKPGPENVSSLRAAGVEELPPNTSSLRAAGVEDRGYSKAAYAPPPPAYPLPKLVSTPSTRVSTQQTPNALQQLLNGPVGNPAADAAIQRIWQGLRSSLQSQLAGRRNDFAGIKGEVAGMYGDAQNQMNQAFQSAQADLQRQADSFRGGEALLARPSVDWKAAQTRLGGLFGSNKATSMGTIDWLAKALEDRLGTALSSAYSGEAFQRAGLMGDLSKVQAEALAAARKLAAEKGPQVTETTTSKNPILDQLAGGNPTVRSALVATNPQTKAIAETKAAEEAKYQNAADRAMAARWAGQYGGATNEQASKIAWPALYDQDINALLEALGLTGGPVTSRTVTNKNKVV